MADIWTGLSRGSWITGDRIAAYPAIMLALTVAATGFVLWSNDGLLPNGSPFGSDFVSYWTAGREALAGNPLVPYDRALFEPAQAALFPSSGYFAFYYPPHYLAYMASFGLLPYHAALIAWTGTTFIFALWALWRIAGGGWRTALLALAFPAAFLTVAHGQNAFLSAALFGAALWLLPHRPVLAGIAFGLLTFKPQLGLLVPLALLAAGQWRAIGAAGLTLAALVAASAGLFGIAAWQAFLAQGETAMRTLTFGWVGWQKMVSIYAALRLAGLGDGAAMAVHAAVALAVAVITVRAWLPASRLAHGTRSALVLTGALIATPFGLSYDLFILAPALAFMARRGLDDGFLAWEKTAMAAVFLAPCALLAMMASEVPFAPLIPLALFALIVRRARAERGAARVAMAGPVPRLAPPMTCPSNDR